MIQITRTCIFKRGYVRTVSGEVMTGQARTGEDKTGQARTGQDRPGQVRTRQDRCVRGLGPRTGLVTSGQESY